MLAEQHQRTAQPRSFAREQGKQRTHGVATFAISDQFDVGVCVRVDAGADGDGVPWLQAVVWQRHGEYRLAVGPHELAKPIADCRQ